MNVRSFQLSDYISVSRLLEEVLSDKCYDETMLAFARQLSWDTDLVLIAVMDEAIVGVIIGTIDNNNGYYYRVAVHTDFQRKGIGKALIEAMKQRFKQRGVNRILVRVDVHNEPFLTVYESAGYRDQDFSRSTKRLQIMNG